LTTAAPIAAASWSTARYGIYGGTNEVQKNILAKMMAAGI